jgi:hypothetical protein
MALIPLIIVFIFNYIGINELFQVGCVRMNAMHFVLSKPGYLLSIRKGASCNTRFISSTCYCKISKRKTGVEGHVPVISHIFHDVFCATSLIIMYLIYCCIAVRCSDIAMDSQNSFPYILINIHCSKKCQMKDVHLNEVCV